MLTYSNFKTQTIKMSVYYTSALCAPFCWAHSLTINHAQSCTAINKRISMRIISRCQRYATTDSPLTQPDVALCSQHTVSSALPFLKRLHLICYILICSTDVWTLNWVGKPSNELRELFSVDFITVLQMSTVHWNYVSCIQRYRSLFFKIEHYYEIQRTILI